jgi:hypothetical protein
MLITARAFQGAAAAALNQRAVDHRRHLHRSRPAAPLSIYGTVLGLAAVGGQLIGGALVETARLAASSDQRPRRHPPRAASPLVPGRAPAPARAWTWSAALITLALVAVVLRSSRAASGWPGRGWAWRGAGDLALFAASRALHRGGACWASCSATAAGASTFQLAFWSGRGVVLPRVRALPATGPRARRAAGRAGLRSSRSPTWPRR